MGEPEQWLQSNHLERMEILILHPNLELSRIPGS